MAFEDDATTAYIVGILVGTSIGGLILMAVGFCLYRKVTREIREEDERINAIIRRDEEMQAEDRLNLAESETPGDDDPSSPLPNRRSMAANIISPTDVSFTARSRGGSSAASPTTLEQSRMSATAFEDPEEIEDVAMPATLATEDEKEAEGSKPTFADTDDAQGSRKKSKGKGDSRSPSVSSHKSVDNGGLSPQPTASPKRGSVSPNPGARRSTGASSPTATPKRNSSVSPQPGSRRSVSSVRNVSNAAKAVKRQSKGAWD